MLLLDLMMEGRLRVRNWTSHINWGFLLKNYSRSEISNHVCRETNEKKAIAERGCWGGQICAKPGGRKKMAKFLRILAGRSGRKAKKPGKC